MKKFLLTAVIILTIVNFVAADLYLEQIGFNGCNGSLSFNGLKNDKNSEGNDLFNFYFEENDNERIKIYISTDLSGCFKNFESYNFPLQNYLVKSNNTRNNPFVLLTNKQLK